MTTRPDQVYQQNQSGRITLTFFSSLIYLH